MSRKLLKQKGVTLIEILIAVAIGGIISSGVATAIVHSFKVNDSTSDRMTAYNNMQNAGFWITYDTMVAQEIDDQDNPSTPGVTEFLTLTWFDWENDEHQITYTLEGTGELYRNYSFQKDGIYQPVETLLITPYIVPGETTCDYAGYMLTLHITVQVGEQAATRTYMVEQRVLS